MNPNPSSQEYILTIVCKDAPGLMYKVCAFLYTHKANIEDAANYRDKTSNLFFIRIHYQMLEDGSEKTSMEDLTERFKPLAQTYSMEFHFYRATQKINTLILVSKLGHCLNDMLFRTRNKDLNIHIKAVVSNHPTFEELVRAHQIPFVYSPTKNADEKKAQEAIIESLIEKERIELIVLARYMQILSPDFCVKYKQKIINIHHSFLPAFKGAKPYHQAFERGVKIIGATAHYVTSELDEGPIIEQEVLRINHALQTTELTQKGNDVETIVLARAVKYHAERRILLNGSKTVIFQ